MRIKGLTEGMTLIISHESWEPCELPWDLRTIFDLDLSLSDTEQLEEGKTLEVGECKLHLDWY